MAPSGNCGTFGTPAGSDVAVAGILKTSQCSLPLMLRKLLASTSFISRTKLWVPAGTLIQDKGKEAPGVAGTLLVYFSGMMPPSSNGRLVKASRGGWGAGVWA